MTGTDPVMMFKDMSLIFVSWLFIFAACFGWGAVFNKIFRFNFKDEDKPFIWSWLGFISFLFIFSILNLFVPINWVSSAAFFVIGLGTAFIYRKQMIVSGNSFQWISFAVMAIIIAAIAVQPPNCYDTGLYHLNSIRWLNEYAIVPGLGNLHHRLGFNQLLFCWNAALNFHPIFNDYAFHVANSFLYMLLGSSLLFSKRYVSKILFALMWCIPTPLYCLPSASIDMAAAVVQLALFFYFIKICGEENLDVPSYVGFSALMAAVSSLIKLSSTLFALGLGITALLYYFGNRVKFKDSTCKGAFIAFFILLLVSVWIIRGYISTGYPLFPTSIGRINFDWALPESLTQHAYDSIYSYARIRKYDLNSPLLEDMKWFKSWFFFQFPTFSDSEGLGVYIYLTVVLLCCGRLTMVFGLISSLLGILFFIIWLIKRGYYLKQYFESRFCFYIWIFAFISLIFWFCQAPDFRFANGLFIIFFVVSLIMVKAVSPSITKYAPSEKALIYSCLLIVLLGFWFNVDSENFSIRGMYALPKVPVKELTTKSGLKVLFPTLSDQPFDSDLPATPEFKPNLALRGKTLAEGFKVTKD